MKITLNNYIIGIKRYNGHGFEHYGEGTVKILKEENEYFLQLHDTKKNALLCENNMTSNMNFSFRKTKNLCQVIVSFNDGIYGIEFDKNSFASFNEFEKNVRKIIRTCVKEVYYASGNLKLSGEFSDGKFNGNGWEFYDISTPIFKYQGEFEDDVYDGEGIFTSKDGLIKVHINNISEGVPIDCGTVTIKGVGEYDIDFGKYSDCKFDTNSDNFCYVVADLVVTNVKEKLFKNLLTEDKVDLLWEKMQELTIKVDKLAANGNKEPFSFW